MPSWSSRTSPEDNLDCPLSVLGLLEILPLTKSYHAVTPPPELLHPLLVAYALVQMKVKRALSWREILFREALYEEGSPGRIFQLDPELLYSYLGKLEADERLVDFSRTAGLDLVMLKVAATVPLHNQDLELELAAMARTLSLEPLLELFVLIEQLRSYLPMNANPQLVFERLVTQLQQLLVPA